ncbi:hypothetical protein AX17_003954 [Amanita inopinata Kibby_2008]|nr:hypothetical protein AX17_003954 [Amanita inopinata Kibby_2008]
MSLHSQSPPSLSVTKMKLVFQTVALFSALCAAHPFAPRQEACPLSPIAPEDGGAVTFTPSSGSSLGAAYFMSNDPSGNYLFAAAIQADGTLALRRAYPTRGTGGHAVSKIPDALFSQDSIITSYVNNAIFLVNAGSNTLTMFRVDPKDPTMLTMVGEPVSSRGDFPNSITLNKRENVLCVANTGKINNVNCFRVHRRGGLSPLQNTMRPLGFNQTTPPSAPTETTGQITFTPDDKQLLVSVKGVPNPGYLAIWDVREDGSLSKRFRTMFGGVATWSISFIPGTNALLSADPLVGYNIFDLDKFAANSSVRGTQYPIKDQVALCWSERSPKTGNYYLTDTFRDVIYEVSVDNNLRPQVVREYPSDRFDLLVDISITSFFNMPDHLYALAANSTAIEVFVLNAPGEASRIQKLDINIPAAQANIKLDGNFAYGMTTWMIDH